MSWSPTPAAAQYACRSPISHRPSRCLSKCRAITVLPASTSSPIAAEAVHLDMLNPCWAVAIRRNVKGPRHLELATLPLPFFLDRAAHLVEMNFPGAADPFGYRKYQPLAR